MSLEKDCYLLYGFKLEGDNVKIFDDNYEELMEKKPYADFFNNCNSEQTIVFDHMWGQYVYIGIKLAVFEEFDATENFEISGDEVYRLKEKLTKYMEAWPDYVVKLCDGKEPKLYFFIDVY